MATLHLLFGLPGTGKSTFAKTLARERSAVVLCNDDWMVRLYGTNPPASEFAANRERISHVQWQLAVMLLSKGTDVIWDYGLWTKAWRTEMVERAKPLGVEILFYRFHCPKELAISRVLKRVREEKGQVLEINEAALELFWDKFESLAPDERFNIIEVDTST